MPMQSDHGYDDGTRMFPAQCAKCGAGLGLHKTNEESQKAEMNHWLQKHPVKFNDDGTPDASGNATIQKYNAFGKPKKVKPRDRRKYK